MMSNKLTRKNRCRVGEGAGLRRVGGGVSRSRGERVTAARTDGPTSAAAVAEDRAAAANHRRMRSHGRLDCGIPAAVSRSDPHPAFGHPPPSNGEGN